MRRLLSEERATRGLALPPSYKRFWGPAEFDSPNSTTNSIRPTSPSASGPKTSTPIARPSSHRPPSRLTLTGFRFAPSARNWLTFRAFRASIPYGQYTARKPRVKRIDAGSFHTCNNLATKTAIVSRPCWNTGAANYRRRLERSRPAYSILASSPNRGNARMTYRMNSERRNTILRLRVATNSIRNAEDFWSKRNRQPPPASLPALAGLR